MRSEIYNDASFSSGSGSLPSPLSLSAAAYHIRNNVSGIFNAFHPKVDMSPRQREHSFLPSLSISLRRRFEERRIYEVNFRIRKQRIPRTNSEERNDAMLLRLHDNPINTATMSSSMSGFVATTDSQKLDPIP